MEMLRQEFESAELIQAVGAIAHQQGRITDYKRKVVQRLRAKQYVAWK